MGGGKPAGVEEIPPVPGVIESLTITLDDFYFLTREGESIRRDHQKL